MAVNMGRGRAGLKAGSVLEGEIEAMSDEAKAKTKARVQELKVGHELKAALGDMSVYELERALADARTTAKYTKNPDIATAYKDIASNYERRLKEARAHEKRMSIKKVR